MNTYSALTQDASDFAVAVKVALAKRRWSMNKLASAIKRHRNSTSRAVNRGEFPAVQKLIKGKLGI